MVYYYNIHCTHSDDPLIKDVEAFKKLTEELLNQLLGNYYGEVNLVESLAATFTVG